MRTLLLLRRLAIPLAVLFCLLLSACQDQPTGTGPTGNETVSGTLGDEIGNLVPGAYVEAINASNARIAFDTTDDYGAFTLTGLPANLAGVQLRVIHGLFRPYLSNIQTVVGMAGGHDGVLVGLLHNDSCCARVIATVTGTNGVALGNVEVKLRRGGALISTGRTDSNGHVTFTNVCDGEFNIRLARDGYHVLERGGIHVNDCDTSRLEFAMQANNNEHHDDTCCNGKLRIVPRDSATNAVISGAGVRITKVGGNTRNLTSNGDGVLFRELCSGTYNVRIAREGYRVVEFQVTLGCNDSVYSSRLMGHIEEHHDDSCCNGRAVVIIRDSATNANVNGATVKLYKGNQLLNTRTTAEGRTVFEGLCAGTYSVSVLKEGYRHFEFTFTITCNQNVELVRTMAAERHDDDTCCHGVITVVVRDSTTNAVIANATVKIWRNGALFRTLTTNANGVAATDGLCAGAYGVSMIREGYRSAEFNVTLTCNQRLETTRKLLHNEEPNDSCCNAVFRFRVKDSTIANDGWLTGVTVTIKKGNTVIATGTTNAEGRYNREAICGYATYTVTFSKDGFHLKTLTFTLTECRTLEETIRIVPE